MGKILGKIQTVIKVKMEKKKSFFSVKITLFTSFFVIVKEIELFFKDKYFMAKEKILCGINRAIYRLVLM